MPLAQDSWLSACVCNQVVLPTAQFRAHMDLASKRARTLAHFGNNCGYVRHQKIKCSSLASEFKVPFISRCRLPQLGAYLD